MTSNYAERARALLGSPFRPQGRDPRFGLDCVGVLLCTFRVPSDLVRSDYQLRGDHLAEIRRELVRFFWRVPRSGARPGDVLLFRIAANQLHLAISCGESFVHADAALRRVVETPGAPPWPVIAAYRHRKRMKH